MADEMLGRADFNRLTSHLTGYGPESEAVLKADLQLAEQQGDARAAASIRRDLQRVGTTTVAENYSGTGLRVPTLRESGSTPVPEARSALAGVTQLAPDFEQAIFAADQSRQESLGRAVGAITAAGEASAQATQLANEADLASQSIHKEILKAIGLDVADPESAIRQELVKEAQTRRARESIDSEIADLEGVSFFQNPLQFMMNQPRLQQLTAQYNKLARVENRSNEEITRLQSLQETALKTPAKAADLLRQAAAAKAAEAVNMAKAKAEEFSAQNASGHAKALMDAFTLRHNVFTSMLQLQTLEEGITDRRQRAQQAEEHFQILRKEVKDKEEQKRLDQETESALLVGINTFRRGIAGTAVPEFTNKDLRAMPAAERQRWYGILYRGNFGNNYQEAVTNIRELGNPAAAASQGNAQMMKTLRDIETRVNSVIPEIKAREYAKNPQAGHLNDKVAREMAYAELYGVDQGTALAGSEKTGLSARSPYFPNFDGIANIALKTGAQNGVVGKTLAAAKGRAQGRNLNEVYSSTQFLNEVEARVIAGEADPRTAAIEVSRFFAQSSNETYTANGLKYFGLPPAVDWYVTPGATGNKRVDLMDPAQVENYLTSRIAKVRAATPSYTETAVGAPGGFSNIFSPQAEGEFVPKGRTRK